ncbi:MAG: peptidylprolyl isomerase [bacterium]
MKRLIAKKIWLLMVAASVAGGLLQMSCGTGNLETDKETLAVIGERVIDKADFMKRYEYFRTKTGQGVHDNLETRRQVLNNYVDEEILIAEAERRGFAQDEQGLFERERVEMQELLNAYYQEKIASRVTVSDAELKRLYVRLNTRVKARHLYAPTKHQADSLYALLQNGSNFGELASLVFKDPRLRDSGGLLGYFTVDEMEPAFEEAAYSLRIGEISKPVRTSDGYSIIRVEDRVTKPLLTESEYARHKNKLAAYWKHRKIRQATAAHVDSLRKTLNIVFNQEVVRKLYAEFKKTQDKARFLEKGFSDLHSHELLRSRFGAWTVATFQQKARFTSTTEHRWIHNQQQFEDFIAGLVIREYLLQRAREARLHERPEYLQKVKADLDGFLLERMEETLKGEMVIPEDSLRSYYNEDPKRFATPPEINLREIVLDDETKATLVADKLEHGESFAELAKKYSVRKWSAEKGGELGFLTPQYLGRWAQTAFLLKVGERAGPLKMDSMIVFLQCIAKRSAKIRSFDTVRDEVERTVRYLAWADYRRSKIKEIRQSMELVKVFPQRLKEIKLK